MNVLTLKSERKLIKGNFEKIYERENKITSIRLNLPAKVGNYNTNECNIELRAYIGENDFIRYEVDTSSIVADVPITTDITEKAQTVNFMCYITHNGNVIGKTNLVSVEVLEAPEEKDPLTPREQFDTVIAEQRQTIQNQAGTISEQSTEITEKDGQISELNGQVEELEAEKAEQAETITRQNTTIDELNRRVPPLQTLDPINPSQVQQTFNPQSPNIGFSQVVVNAPTAEGLNFDYADLREGVMFLGEPGTYAPTYGTTKGGIYITKEKQGLPEEIVFRNWKVNCIDNFISDDLKHLVSSIVFDNCGYVEKISGTAFSHFDSLSTIVFPENLKTIGGAAFEGTGDGVSTLAIPETVETFDVPLYLFLSTKFKRIVLPQNAICTNEGLAAFFVSGSIIEEINIPHGFTSLRPQFMSKCTSLKKIFLPNTLISVSSTWCDNGGRKLEYITLENGFNCSIYLAHSTLYSQETIVSWLNALADRTGQTAYTLTIGTTNINKLTAEQRAIATNKNWNLA